MLTAIQKVHLANGPWTQNGGWEYNAVLIAVALGIADAGPGPLSLDALLDFEHKGPLFGIAGAAAARSGWFVRGDRDGQAPRPGGPETTAYA